MTINNSGVALEVFFVPRKVGAMVVSNTLSLVVLVNDWRELERSKEETVTGKGLRVLGFVRKWGIYEGQVSSEWARSISAVCSSLD